MSQSEPRALQGLQKRPVRAAELPLLALASTAWHAVVVGSLLTKRISLRHGAAALLANHAVLSLAGCAPRAEFLGPNLSRLPNRIETDSCPDVVLTFDDGPDPDVTPAIAEILESRGLRASFFCIGRHMQQHPQLTRDLHRAGHRIENHTYHHASAFAFSLLPALNRELQATQDLVATLTGREPAWFRAPAGMRNPLLEKALADLGLHYVSWTRRAFDTVEKNPEKILGRLLRNLRQGDILLLHDGNAAHTSAGSPAVLDVLPRLLDHLESKGLTAGPLPDPEALPTGKF